MTQQVKVLSVEGDYAKVEHRRPTACHMDCEHCSGGCGATAAKEVIILRAKNLIGARAGDSVIIAGKTGKVAQAIFLVYILPIVLFFLGYALGAKLCGMGAAFGVGGFALGVLAAVAAGRAQRRRGTEISYEIIAYAGRN